MIKILHFVSTPAKWSGVMSVLMNYYRHIDRTKIQFEFLCFSPCKDTYEEEILSLGGKVYFIPKPSTFVGLKRLLDFFKVHVNEYEWLHNHEIYLSFLLKPLAQQYGITHFIVHSHTTQYSDQLLNAIRNFCLCIPIRFMDCNRFACSKAAGVFLFGKDKKTFQIMPNAIEIQKFLFNPDMRKIYRQKLNVDTEFLIGHIGRFVPQKNHEFIISLFKQLYSVEPRIRLILIGDGELKREIQERVVALGLKEKVFFVGYREDIANYLQAIDLFLLPSKYEGLPMACLEAQAAGLPCIISSNITSEVELSSMVHRVDLNDMEGWMRECLIHVKKYLENREINIRKCVASIPNIYEEAEKITHFYERGNKN